MIGAFSFAELDRLAGTCTIARVPCPVCGPQHKAKKKRTLTIWRGAGRFASFACGRCEVKGYARPDSAGPRLPPAQVKALRHEAETRRAEEVVDRLSRARFLWSRRRLVEGSPAERYLRDARGYSGPIPTTLGYLPARGDHGHAMIAAFGIATEPEPGELALADEAVVGIHLTKLNADGSAKADTDPNKIMVGRSSGFPICLAPPNDLLGLAVTEGIEDALSVHQATGLGVWAAGAAGRMPALADKVPAYVDCVTVVSDADPAGQAGAHGLAEALVARGFEVILQGSPSW